MKVFISWSGQRSKALANSIKDWLPLILQYSQPWVSDKDIGAGDQWAQAIAEELETSNFGILCITPENLNSQWILFEAGALSKSMQDAKVIPLLFGLELSDLSGPLSQFQALKVDQQGMLETIKAINAVSERKAPEATIDQLVPDLWQRLQQKLDEIPERQQSEKHTRPQTEILEDLVSQVRGLGARMSSFDPEVIDMEKRPKRVEGQSVLVDYRILEDIEKRLMKSPEAEFMLPMLAGILRDDAPWLAEIIIEGHRELKTATHENVLEIGQNLHRAVEIALSRPWTDRMARNRKSAYKILYELPRFIDRSVSHRMDVLYGLTGDVFN
ncbi:MAG: toll/interleukin-1 receptor domain-containing protein [Ruegeria sp.]